MSEVSEGKDVEKCTLTSACLEPKTLRIEVQTFTNRQTDRHRQKKVPLHAMKALGGEEVWLLLILTLGTRWG
jgi:hypothetical protein